MVLKATLTVIRAQTLVWLQHEARPAPRRHAIIYSWDILYIHVCNLYMYSCVHLRPWHLYSCIVYINMFIYLFISKLLY